MSVFFFKSLMGIGILVSAVIAVFTMLEIFGRSEKKYNIEKLKKSPQGKRNSLFFTLYPYRLFLSGFYHKHKDRAFTSGADTFLICSCNTSASWIEVFYFKGIHPVLQSGENYRNFDSASYFRHVCNVRRILSSYHEIRHRQGVYGGCCTKKEPMKEEVKIVLKTDPESIRKGKELYGSKCYFCHDAYSTKRGGGGWT